MKLFLEICDRIRGCTLELSDEKFVKLSILVAQKQNGYKFFISFAWKIVSSFC